ncbi:MAG: alkyl hydroperoxide reductase [Pseudomonadota bacterium]
MSLLTYKEARPWAKSIRNVVSDGTMPPWFADPAHGDFVEDPRLTDAQIDAVNRWVAAGAPAGDLSKAPEPPKFDSEWRMGTPDLILTMEPFTVTDDMEDHYEWIKVENTLDEDRWIKGFEIKPSFMAAAHHNLTYLAPAHFDAKDIQGAGRMDMDYVGGWAPGVQPAEYAEGYGQLMPANSAVFFQMHYHNTPGPGTGGVDQTQVALKFHDGEPENKLTTMWVVDPVLRIPPNEANYASQSEWTFPHDAVVFDFTPHMHLRGKAMKFTAFYPDGTEDVLLDVPNYDFNWQLTYTPKERLEIPAGTKIVVDAVFDNSSENLANPDPSIMVTWGEKTTDEMMIGFMHYSYLDRANQADMETHAVPPALAKQMKALREMRKKAAQKSEESEADDR